MLIPTCTIKFFELILSIGCLVLHQYSYDLTDLSTLMLCSGTYVGYLIVLSGELVGELALKPLDLAQDIYFGILGVCLYCTSGGLVLFSRFRDTLVPRTGDVTAALVLGGLSIFTAMFILFDVALAYIDSEEYDEDREMMSSAADVYVDMWWSAWGSVLFGGCGAMTMFSWHQVAPCFRKTLATAASICALVNAFVLLFDAAVTLCFIRNDNAKSPREVGNNR